MDNCGPGEQENAWWTVSYRPNRYFLSFEVCQVAQYMFEGDVSSLEDENTEYQCFEVFADRDALNTRPKKNDCPRKQKVEDFEASGPHC